jgi:hypothetical protein
MTKALSSWNLGSLLGPYKTEYSPCRQSMEPIENRQSRPRRLHHLE